MAAFCFFKLILEIQLLPLISYRSKGKEAFFNIFLSQFKAPNLL